MRFFEICRARNLVFFSARCLFFSKTIRLSQFDSIHGKKCISWQNTKNSGKNCGTREKINYFKPTCKTRLHLTTDYILQNKNQHFCSTKVHFFPKNSTSVLIRQNFAPRVVLLNKNPKTEERKISSLCQLLAKQMWWKLCQKIICLVLG